MKNKILASLIAAALAGSACERRPVNVPANTPSVNVPVRPRAAGPVYIPPAPVLSKEEQLAQKTVSADVARYVLSNRTVTFEWSELPDSTKATYGDAAEIVENGEALFSTCKHYFSHHQTLNQKSTVYITPRVVETGDKYKLALEVVTFRNGDSMQVLRVDDGLDGTVDKAFQAEGSGNLKPPYKMRENELDDFIFDFNLKVYRKKVIDKEQH